MPATSDQAGTPRVTIGLPVYNGERYLEEALDSLLAQTFDDFELIISDNASIDRTPDICRAYATRDPRIRYSRLDTNIGGFRNHNRVVALARAEYFTWAAHDDCRAPEHLARCVEVLDKDPGVVLCFTGVRPIDGEGASLPERSFVARIASEDPAERWRDMVLGDWVYDPNYGVIRMSALLRSGLLSQHADADRVLLGELALQGRFHRVEQPLFMRRFHASNSGRQYPSPQKYAAWYAPEQTPRIVFPYFRKLRGLVASQYRTRLPFAARLSCLRTMARWILNARRVLRDEVTMAAREAWTQTTRRLRGAR